MKIELKNIKHSEFASQETNCYQATIYIDGKKVGTVENAGHGGCDNVHPWQVAQQIDDYAKTLPKTVCTFIDPETGKPTEMEQDHETIFGDILTSWLMSKDLKRLMSKRIVFVKEDGNVYETKALKADQLKINLNQGRLPEMLKAKTILNLLPFDQALTIYRGASA
jgi:hypothetical protein